MPGPHKHLKVRALAGRYDNPIPSLFLAHIDSLKIPAPVSIELIIEDQALSASYELAPLPLESSTGDVPVQKNWKSDNLLTQDQEGGGGGAKP